MVNMKWIILMSEVIDSEPQSLQRTMGLGWIDGETGEGSHK